LKGKAFFQVRAHGSISTILEQKLNCPEKTPITMLSRILLASICSLSSLLAFAQTTTTTTTTTPISKKKFVKLNKMPNKALCVNERSYTPEQIKSMSLFADAAQVKLVSYFKIKTVNNTDEILSLITENGKFEPAKWQEEITLNEAQKQALGNILFNYGNKVVPYRRDQPECFMPNNAILFLDKFGNVSSVIELSFACETMVSMPNRLGTGTWCSEKFDVMRKFFEDAGMKFFGMDD
jgi:hypothetical protein